ncbi:hypothetical protein HHK36_022051 [Tetracentron sinense]|uniref:FAR1 domain-containing protein n=1 Tax=Tetracentron sinense TaxID=13715 RepID=A0A835D8J5_TETSI|nr:hypothetical protein HHK36_022051 [Tetracentron sinense]
MSEDERMMEDFDRMEPDEDLNNEMMESSFEKELGGVEGGETTDISNERELNAREVYGNVEPHIGMEFESEKAAMMYYEAYGERVGFVIRVNFAQRSRDKSVVSRTFVCNKEGFRKEDRRSKSEVRNPRPVTRVGCKAMFTVRKEKPGKWIVTRLETKHNHPLGIPSGQGRRSAVQPRQFRPQMIFRFFSNAEKELRTRTIILNFSALEIFFSVNAGGLEVQQCPIYFANRIAVIDRRSSSSAIFQRRKNNSSDGAAAASASEKGGGGTALCGMGAVVAVAAQRNGEG